MILCKHVYLTYVISNLYYNFIYNRCGIEIRTHELEFVIHKEVGNEVLSILFAFILIRLLNYQVFENVYIL